MTAIPVAAILPSMNSPRHISRIGIVGIALVCLALAVSCRAAQPGPDQAAKAWIDALIAGNGEQVERLTCKRQQAALKNEAAMITAGAIIGRLLAREFLGGVLPKISAKELRYQTTREQGDTATVRIQGRMRVSILLLTETQEIDQTVKFVRENGRWTFCDGPPGAGA